MVGVEPEIIKCSEAYRVGVLVGRKRFRAPGDRGAVLGNLNIPRCAAVSGVSYGAIVRDARMLRRRMKLDVTNVDSSS